MRAGTADHLAAIVGLLGVIVAAIGLHDIHRRGLRRGAALLASGITATGLAVIAIGARSAGREVLGRPPDILSPAGDIVVALLIGSALVAMLLARRP